MRDDPRGPYFRIRWFCADGTSHPVRPYPCADRGGGVQHASYSPQRRRLAELGIHVGTILEAEGPEALLDPAGDWYRLRELVLETWLVGVDGGWVLHRGRYYRGARQVEDEERRGQEILETLLADTAFLRTRPLLARRLVETLPHPSAAGGGRTARIRALATEAAAADPSFQALRAKIHSMPSREDLDSVRARLAAGPPEAARGALESLRAALEERHAPGAAAALLEGFGAGPTTGHAEALASLRAAIAAGRRAEALAGAARLAVTLRRETESRADGPGNIARLELSSALQEVAFELAAAGGVDDKAPRADRVRELLLFCDLAYGDGLLSERERSALRERAEALTGGGVLTVGAWRDGVGYLARSLDWAWAALRAGFGPVAHRWARVEPLAAGFLDAEARGSILLPLSARLDVLHADADRAVGAPHLLFGREAPSGVRGLNPGFAVGPLRILDPGAGPAEIDPDGIYVLPSSEADLRPVAGILTADAGNLLSHIQLLARGLGVPNAALGTRPAPEVAAAAGRTVALAVSPMGRVWLGSPDSLPPRLRELARAGGGAGGADPGAAAEPGPDAGPVPVSLDVGRLRLDRFAPEPVARLRATDAGVTVGPKAANVGELAARFPGHVAPGVALPFGLFLRHVDRPFAGAPSALGALRAAFREADSLRAAGRPQAEVDARIFTALAGMREAIAGLPWRPDDLARIDAALRETFGPDLSDGVFVRSDTNVEDLAGFSGAGLNLTVPHVVTREGVLAAIRRVWSSPFGERAYLWRRRVVANPADVYPSVLLLASVPSEKSGVLVTTGLEGDDPVREADQLTIATAEGVGGVVDGGAAETLLVEADGSVTLLSSARQTERRVLRPEGGVARVPAKRPERLLSEDEIAALRDLARRIEDELGGGTPWDVEFGFAEGRLWLFQVRPFVRFGGRGVLSRLADVLDGGIRAALARPLDPDEPI
ncbi:MAG: PEP/pyruvate-binding domain-containing protein [Gemmatimonadota bacterium]|nr:PEP/pyruvate-binding domain-containing protein [Gemmatimonadota bacterium]